MNIIHLKLIKKKFFFYRIFFLIYNINFFALFTFLNYMKCTPFALNACKRLKVLI